MNKFKKIIKLLGVFLLTGCSANGVKLELKPPGSIKIEYEKLVNTDFKVKTTIDGTQTYCYEGVYKASIDELYTEP